MVYKNGPPYRARDVKDIKKDLVMARDLYGESVASLFFPAGNTIAMKTDDLCAICQYAHEVFPDLDRITVYGSSQYIRKKGLAGLKKLKKAGLSRIHAGLESGDDLILKKVKKGTTANEQIEAGRLTMEAGLELSLYVILGLGGRARSREHARETATALNAINPDFIRLRTFVPKTNTPMLKEVQEGGFIMLGPHGILKETRELVAGLNVTSFLASDHYTNYINIEGRIPESKKRIADEIDQALCRSRDQFRDFFVGSQ